MRSNFVNEFLDPKNILLVYFTLLIYINAIISCFQKSKPFYIHLWIVERVKRIVINQLEVVSGEDSQYFFQERKQPLRWCVSFQLSKELFNRNTVDS